MERWKEKLILRVEKDNASFCKDLLVREEELELYINGKFSLSLFGIPEDLEALAVGYALGSRMLDSREEISSLIVTKNRIDLGITSSKSKHGNTPELTLNPEQVYTLWEQFDEQCITFRRTGMTHAVGLASAGGLLFVKEDAARHNALAKVLGEALLKDISTYDKALVFSGRMSGELIKMASACEAPILLCHGAATLLAVERAEALGITLAGFVRRGYMNLYSHSERIIQIEKLERKKEEEE